MKELSLSRRTVKVAQFWQRSSTFFSLKLQGKVSARRQVSVFKLGKALSISFTAAQTGGKCSLMLKVCDSPCLVCHFKQ